MVKKFVVTQKLVQRVVLGLDSRKKSQLLDFHILAT